MVKNELKLPGIESKSVSNKASPEFFNFLKIAINDDDFVKADNLAPKTETKKDQSTYEITAETIAARKLE